MVAVVDGAGDDISVVWLVGNRHSSWVVPEFGWSCNCLHYVLSFDIWNKVLLSCTEYVWLGRASLSGQSPHSWHLDLCWGMRWNGGWKGIGHVPFWALGCLLSGNGIQLPCWSILGVYWGLFPWSKSWSWSESLVQLWRLIEFLQCLLFGLRLKGSGMW